MSKAVGLAIGAAVLSVTIGVLVGVVIHAGQLERADRTDGNATAGATAIGAVESAAELTPPALSGPLVSLTPGAPAASEPALPNSEPALPNSGPALPNSEPTTGLPTNGPTTGSAAPATAVPSTSTMSGSSTPTSADATTPAGPDIADAPCDRLAARSTDPADTTLYCQLDQQDRTLRWRAVTLGGGCLSQKMTGTGADGIAYACRLDDSGRNHWAPAAL